MKLFNKFFKKDDDHQMRIFIDMQQQISLLEKEVNGYKMYCKNLEKEHFSRLYPRWQDEALKNRELFNEIYGYNL